VISLGTAQGHGKVLISADVLDRVLGAWLSIRAALAGGRLIIAIDGKTVRGAKSKGGKAPHLVAAPAHGIGAVLGQVAVDEKPSEIPAVRDLLKAFADLAGAVITIDALHTQIDTAQVILGRGAGYAMTVKGNMPTLYRKLKKLPWPAIPSASAVSTGHGRRARRTIKVALAPAWTVFADAARPPSRGARSRRRARRPSRLPAPSPASAMPTRLLKWTGLLPAGNVVSVSSQSGGGSP
jgi:hypothetical protein